MASVSTLKKDCLECTRLATAAQIAGEEASTASSLGMVKSVLVGLSETVKSMAEKQEEDGGRLAAVEAGMDVATSRLSEQGGRLSAVEGWVEAMQKFLGAWSLVRARADGATFEDEQTVAEFHFCYICAEAGVQDDAHLTFDGCNCKCNYSQTFNPFANLIPHSPRFVHYPSRHDLSL